MADSFDRYDNEGSGGGGFMMGLLTGTVLGAGLSHAGHGIRLTRPRTQRPTHTGQVGSIAVDERPRRPTRSPPRAGRTSSGVSTRR